MYIDRCNYASNTHADQSWTYKGNAIIDDKTRLCWPNNAKKQLYSHTSNGVSYQKLIKARSGQTGLKN